MKYKVILEEEADGGYSIYVPELPGCASQGDSRREALHNIRKAVKLYLWSVREDKRALEKRKVEIKDIAA